MNDTNPNNGTEKNIKNTNINVSTVPNNNLTQNVGTISNNMISQNNGVYSANSVGGASPVNNSLGNISDTLKIEILQNTSTNVINTQEVAAAYQNQSNQQPQAVQQVEQPQQAQQIQTETTSTTFDKEEKYRKVQENYKPPSKFKT